MMTEPDLLSSKEWHELNELLDSNNRTVRVRMTHKDREIAKAILECKQHLGPLGMIEVALVIARLKSET